jgi:hypothetical protein
MPIRDKRNSSVLIWLFITCQDRLKITSETNFCRCQACNPTVWYHMVVSHGWPCDTTCATFCDVMYIVEHLTTCPSDVIAPVDVIASSWRYRVIAPIWEKCKRRFFAQFALVRNLGKNVQCIYLFSHSWGEHHAKDHGNKPQVSLAIIIHSPL